MKAMKKKTEGFGNYMTLLASLGFISPRADAMQAWHMWMRVAESPEVLNRVKKRMGKNFSGPVSGYSHGPAALNAMSKKDLAALKTRLGIQPEVERAVRQ